MCKILTKSTDAGKSYENVAVLPKWPNTARDIEKNSMTKYLTYDAGFTKLPGICHIRSNKCVFSLFQLMTQALRQRCITTLSSTPLTCALWPSVA